MKHKNSKEVAGHAVSVYEKKKLILREIYPTYGKAMWRIVELEKLYPKSEIEYRDTRSFRVDTYE
jgi:hypothetical protein